MSKAMNASKGVHRVVHSLALVNLVHSLFIASFIAFRWSWTKRLFNLLPLADWLYLLETDTLITDGDNYGRTYVCCAPRRGAQQHECVRVLFCAIR
jgi:hypothetical protein